MKRVLSAPFLIACALVLAFFAFYQSFYGDEHNQAHASLNSGETKITGYRNYKPAHKRQIRSRLGEDVDSILDLNGHDIAQIFDAPELVRRDLPTTIWQYRNDACVMDVYFTVGVEGDVARSSVAHYEVRARDLRSEKKFDVSDCVRDLVQHNTVASLIDIKSVYKASAR